MALITIRDLPDEAVVADLVGTQLTVVEDLTTSDTRKATLARLRTAMLAGGTGYAADDAINGATLTLSGAMSAASAAFAGALSAASLALSGALSAASLTLSGAATLAAVSATTIGASGTITGAGAPPFHANNLAADKKFRSSRTGAVSFSFEHGAGGYFYIYDETNARVGWSFDSAGGVSIGSVAAPGGVGFYVANGRLRIDQNGAAAILNDDVNGTDATTLVYLSFQRAGAERGWVGFGDGASGRMRVQNLIGDLWLTANASGARVRLYADSNLGLEITSSLVTAYFPLVTDQVRMRTSSALEIRNAGGTLLASWDHTSGAFTQNYASFLNADLVISGAYLQIVRNSAEVDLFLTRTGTNALNVWFFNGGTSMGLYDGTNARTVWAYFPGSGGSIALNYPVTMASDLNMAATTGGRVYFTRNDGTVAVGGIGWHSDSYFYVGGHPAFSPGAGSNMRVYGFSANLELGTAGWGGIITLQNADGRVWVGATGTAALGRLSVQSGPGQAGFNIGTSASPQRANLWFDTDGSGWELHIGKWQSSAFTAIITVKDNLDVVTARDLTAVRDLFGGRNLQIAGTITGVTTMTASGDITANDFVLA